MTTSPSDKIRASLLESRARADRIIGDAERNASELSALAAETDRARTRIRLERLDGLQGQIEGQQQRIDSAYATMAEAMASASRRLAEIAREADFSNPPWPSGIRRTVEIKLAETREVTFRIETETPGRGEPPSRRV